jgi:hypothetical protein
VDEFGVRLMLESWWIYLARIEDFWERDKFFRLFFEWD